MPAGPLSALAMTMAGTPGGRPIGPTCKGCFAAMTAKSNAPRSLPASVSRRRPTGFLRPIYAPEPCGESCAIVSRPEFRSAPCDPRPAVSPAKSPSLLIAVDPLAETAVQEIPTDSRLHGEAKTASAGSVPRVPAADIEDVIVKSLKKHLAANQGKSATATLQGDRGDLAELVAGIVVHRDRLMIRLKSDKPLLYRRRQIQE